MSAIKKMFILEAGRIIVPDDDPHAALHTDTFKYTIPVPAILLEHEIEGLIIIDAGIHPDYFPEGQRKRLIYGEKAQIDLQLKKIGYSPEDVKHVLMSHWHRDHHGQVFLFKNATMHMREAELDGLLNHPKEGFPPGEVEAWEQYLKDCPEVNIQLMPADIEIDVFGDGSVIAIDSKGHTPGQQSFLVSLKESGNWLFAMDAMHDKTYLNSNMIFQRAWNVTEMKASIQRLSEIALAKDAKLIFGHDAEQWEELKLFPENYQ